MIYNLRKGSSHVFLQYSNVGDTISAQDFTLEFRDDAAILGFKLCPVGSNQKADELRLYSETLIEIQIGDDYIIGNLSKHLKSNVNKFKAFNVEIKSQDKIFKYIVNFGAVKMNVLPLLIKHKIN